MASKNALTKIDTSLSRDKVVQKLKAVVAEWQEVAESEEINLVEIQASVGLIFYDIFTAIGLDDQDLAKVLGEDLPLIKQSIDDPIKISA